MASCIPKGAGGIAIGTYQFLAGLIEFGLERILHRQLGASMDRSRYPPGHLRLARYLEVSPPVL